MSPQELMRLWSDVVIDLRGDHHTWVLVELEQCACTVPLGDVMEVVSDMPDVSVKVCDWAERRGYEYMGTIEEPGCSRVFVRRTH